MPLRLRPYETRDEVAAVALHEAMLGEGFHFLLGFEPGMPWPAFLSSIEDQRRGLNLPPHYVRGTQLVADVDGEIVGRASLRFELNDFLAERGGHIGYGVARAHRRKGYATEILRQALIVIRAEGVDAVLVTCEKDNVGSFRAIEHNGGVLESFASAWEGDPIELRRYWIV
ncbi:MAG: GNAT family N-acetyltransferase [Acidimicrobiales bacterium]